MGVIEVVFEILGVFRVLPLTWYLRRFWTLAHKILGSCSPARGLSKSVKICGTKFINLEKLGVFWALPPSPYLRSFWTLAPPFPKRSFPNLAQLWGTTLSENAENRISISFASFEKVGVFWFLPLSPYLRRLWTLAYKISVVCSSTLGLSKNFKKCGPKFNNFEKIGITQNLTPPKLSCFWTLPHMFCRFWKAQRNCYKPPKFYGPMFRNKKVIGWSNFELCSRFSRNWWTLAHIFWRFWKAFGNCYKRTKFYGSKFRNKKVIAWSNFWTLVPIRITLQFLNFGPQSFEGSWDVLRLFHKCQNVWTKVHQFSRKWGFFNFRPIAISAPFLKSGFAISEAILPKFGKLIGDDNV